MEWWLCLWIVGFSSSLSVYLLAKKNSGGCTFEKKYISTEAAILPKTLTAQEDGIIDCEKYINCKKIFKES